MNKERRKTLDVIVSAIEDIHNELTDLKDDLDGVLSAEEDSFENMPEGLQQTESGQKIEAAKNALQDAANDMDTVLQALDDCRGNINTAME